jgi:hypothetical protein
MSDVLITGRQNLWKEVAQMGDKGRTVLPTPTVDKPGDMLLKAGHSLDTAKLFGLSEQPGVCTKSRSHKDRAKTKAAKDARKRNRKKKKKK